MGGPLGNIQRTAVPETEPSLRIRPFSLSMAFDTVQVSIANSFSKSLFREYARYQQKLRDGPGFARRLSDGSIIAGHFQIAGAFDRRRSALARKVDRAFPVGRRESIAGHFLIRERRGDCYV